MTNNDNLKKDATELLNKVIDFKRSYNFISGGPKAPAAIDAFERELRLVLKVVRTDEENNQQSQTDSYC